MGKQNPLVIAIDTGNRCIKTANHVMVAGLYATDLEPVFKNDSVIKYGDNYYSLSSRRGEYNHDKTQNEDYFILSLFGIAEELETRNVPCDEASPAPEVVLAVGLPPAHMQMLRDKFKEYFLRGRVCYERNGVKCHIEIIDVHVMPQAFSAAYLNYADLRHHDFAYIVDIGGYTTDIIGLENGSVNPATCLSENAGMIHLYHKIHDELIIRYACDLNEQQVDKLLTDPGYDPEPGMKEVAQKCADSYINRLIRRLAEKGINLRICKGVFVGGGASRLLPQIKSSPLIRDPLVISDIRANARGYEAIVLNKLNRKAR